MPRSRLASPSAVTLTSPIDGRVMFVLPWEDLAYIGTTETDAAGAPDDLRATGDDVIYLLRSANAFFPEARLAPADVVATWAGVRPLLAPDKAVSSGRVSREHRVVESATGFLTIAGGKLTTHRVMGRDVADRVARRLRALDGRPVAPAPATDALPLPGGETADLDVLVDGIMVRNVTEQVARHLVAHYGSEAHAVLNLVEKHRVLGKPLVEGRPEIRAEVVHAVEREMAMRLSDVLIRRTHLYYEDPAQGVKSAPAVARKLRELLGWDGERESNELAGYLALVERGRKFLKEVGRASAGGTPRPA